MGGITFGTGNTIVDENARLNISGNIIPQMWYKTIVRDSGKPNLTAIIILADIVYWYKPTEIRDENTGQVIAVKKKFKSDLLQRSYQQISEQFGISKKEATNAVIFLEKLGVIKRVFRTITINGLVINNVLYLELLVSRLKALTYPETKSESPVSFERDRGKGEEGSLAQSSRSVIEISSKEEGAVTFERGRVSTLKEPPIVITKRESTPLENTAVHLESQTNTEIIPESSTENNPRTTTEIINRDYNNPIQSYQNIEEEFKAQIDYDAIWIDRPYDRNLLNEIVAISVDVLTSKAETLRINKEDRPALVVQGVYKKLDKYSVEYVMNSMRACSSKANNIRAVLMTALYNATMTASSYIANLFAYHEALPQT
jgi:DNA-binding Lrp family transcriptional regulator